eukprot:g3352.t1
MSEPSKDGVDKGEDGLTFESSAFEALERDFQEVLQELVGDKSLERFRSEYEKLHRALKKSHEQEKRLIKRCRELNAEIVNNAAKVQTALKLSQEDQHTITSLKKEIEKAWKMVDASHEKEVRAKETIQKLKMEIANLSKLVEQGAGLSIGQDNTVQELINLRDDLKKQVEDQATSIKSLKDHMNTLNGRIVELEGEKDEQSGTIKELNDLVAQREAEQARDRRRKKRLDEELKDLKTQLEVRLQEIGAQNREGDAQKDKIRRLETQLKEARGTMEKQVQAMDTLFGKTQKLAEDLDTEMIAKDAVTKELHRMEAELKQRDTEITNLVNDNNGIKRRVDKEKKKTVAMQQRVADAKQARDMVVVELTQVQKDLEVARRREDALAKNIESLNSRLEVKDRAIAREVDRTKAQADLVSMEQRKVKALEDDIHVYAQEAAKQRKLIYQLEKERERLGSDAAEVEARYQKVVDEVKLKEMQITDMGKKVTESEQKLKQQQQLYEAVRSDRNLYSKNLIESQDEIAEMKRKFKIMSHQIEQLKEEITAKDHALVKEHFDHAKVEKEKEGLRNELSKMKKLLDDNAETIDSQNQELIKLTSMIQKMDAMAIQQRNEYEQVINERDILGTQLIRRNDELALLYEKIKIQQSTLRKGEAQYQERLNDLRVLKLKVKDVMRELMISRKQGSQTDDLKREVFRLQKDLLQEKTKVKALSEELENPMNVHRWRKLEGSDPATYEMIQKIQTLQKRLIMKTEEVVEKDLLIQEKEKLYVELKNILARQPGPEVAEQLSVYQHNLKEKTRQMKAMASELNMHQAQVNEHRFEIERLTRELQDVKRKYYETKRKDQLARNSARNGDGGIDTMAAMQVAQAQASTNRFTGGGFNLQSAQ